jgi:hypothetical protein
MTSSKKEPISGGVVPTAEQTIPTSENKSVVSAAFFDNVGMPMSFRDQQALKWHWVFMANLTLETPLAVLQRHEDSVDPDSILETPMSAEAASMMRPSMSNDESTYGEWVIMEKSEAPEESPEEIVVMDIPSSACTPTRYLAFLTRFRTIIEANDLPKVKRKRLGQWLEEETWNDVLTWWRGYEGFMDRVVPKFLAHLNTQGVPASVTNQLELLGIDNRLALTRLLRGKLGLDLASDIQGVTPKITEVLEWFCVRDHLMAMIDENADNEAIDDATRQQALGQIDDPYIQTIY